MSIPINKSNAFTSISVLSGSNLTLQSGSIVPFALPASYVIFSGSVAGYTGPYYAINGTTNQISFYGADAGTIIQSSINGLSNGGKIALKTGTFSSSGSINLPISGITIEGESDDSTILSFTSQTSDGITFTTGSGVRRCGITRLKITTTRSNSSGSAINI